MIGFILDVERHSAAAQHGLGKNTNGKKRYDVCAREHTQIRSHWNWYVTHLDGILKYYTRSEYSVVRGGSSGSSSSSTERQCKRKHFRTAALCLWRMVRIAAPRTIDAKYATKVIRTFTRALAGRDSTGKLFKHFELESDDVIICAHACIDRNRK